MGLSLGFRWNQSKLPFGTVSLYREAWAGGGGGGTDSALLSPSAARFAAKVQQLEDQPNMFRVYSPPQVDGIRLWVYFNEIPYTPYSIYLRGTIGP